jgi:hypothetical protein
MLTYIIIIISGLGLGTIALQLIMYVVDMKPQEFFVWIREEHAIGIIILLLITILYIVMLIGAFTYYQTFIH